MGQVEREYEATPDQVWGLLGDFGGLRDYMPGIDALRMEGDDRVISMLGLEIRERLVAKDDAARSLTYSVVDGVPIEKHVATITVHGSGAGSKVTWSFEIEPEEMEPIFAGTYEGALLALNDRFA